MATDRLPSGCFHKLGTRNSNDDSVDSFSPFHSFSACSFVFPFGKIGRKFSNFRKKVGRFANRMTQDFFFFYIWLDVTMDSLGFVNKLDLRDMVRKHRDKARGK